MVIVGAVVVVAVVVIVLILAAAITATTTTAKRAMSLCFSVVICCEDRRAHLRDEVRGKFKVVLQDNGKVSVRVVLEHFFQRESDHCVDSGRGACRCRGAKASGHTKKEKLGSAKNNKMNK